jgi:hypothetical protein
MSDNTPTARGGSNPNGGSGKPLRKERGPGAGVAAEQEAVQNDDAGQDSDQAEDYMDLKHRRRLPYVRTAHFRPALAAALHQSALRTL